MNTKSRQSIITGTILAALAVALGAFGTHALRPRLDAHYFDVFETGVRYQMYHALALILLGLTIQIKPLPKIIYIAFLTGTIIFSVTLYGIVFGSLSDPNPVKWLGAITPIGGILLICGWILYTYNIIKK